ncbi:gp74 Mycobacterium phage Gadjet [Vaccinia virus]|uniref:Gp74 Mycobacterium phage Gadjet n=1 Tax=Vaccinia virus TaxID=10245 RepID=A0A160NBZ8_VACCV|nr:gp74 Mycobacterium phage Gadjet [Vaccinia virus]
MEEHAERLGMAMAATQTETPFGTEPKRDLKMTYILILDCY